MGKRLSEYSDTRNNSGMLMEKEYPINGYGPRLGNSWKEFKIRFRGNFILGALDAFGGKPAPKGVIRKASTACKLMKIAEKAGWYD